MSWFKNLLKKKKVEELPDLETNENVFRVTYVEQTIDQPNYIICNGKQVEIEWDQVVRFDNGGLGYPESNYRKRSKRTPKMITAHWDACLNTAQMHQVTLDRGLSVHFGIDNDGTIHQMLDTKDIAWHARGINTHSVGVEIANPVKLRYNARYKKKGLPSRPIVVDDKIHGKKMAPYLDFYPVQIEAFKALARAVCKAHGIPFVAPLDKEGSLVRGVDKRVIGRSFRGVVGHYHVTPEKTDPGIMPLDKIANELAEEE